MPEQASVEVKAEAVTPEAETVKPEAVEAPSAEALTPEGAVAPVEAQPVEAPQEAEAEEAKEEAEDKPDVSLSEMRRIIADFGNDIAIKILTDGGTYDDAMRMAYETAKEENARLKAELASGDSHGTPVKVVPAKDQSKSKLFNTGR